MDCTCSDFLPLFSSKHDIMLYDPTQVNEADVILWPDSGQNEILLIIFLYESKIILRPKL